MISLFQFTNELCLDSNIEIFADDSTAYFIDDSIDSISIQIHKLLDQWYWTCWNCMFIQGSIHRPNKAYHFKWYCDDKLIRCVSSSSVLLEGYFEKQT